MLRQVDHRPDIPPRLVALIALAGVGFAFLLVLLPGPEHETGGLAIAGALGVVVIGLAMLWSAVPQLARIGAPVAYVALIAMLLDDGGGTSAGYGGLFLLPLLWLAVTGSRRELVLGFVAVFLARMLPVRLIGPPQYPSSEWRAVLVLGAVAIISTLTIQRLVQDGRARAAELAAQNAKLRELDNLKDEFVGLVSHELRTPLASIVGYLELIEEEAHGLTADERQYLMTVSRNVDRLVSLVNDLLFIVQLDAGRLELSLAEADIAELLSEATDAARPAAAAKSIELTLATDDLEPAVCDRLRIAQLVDNLVSNAVKFTPEGGRIEVRAEQEEAAIALTISDTGIGIPASEIPSLFGRFFRASSAKAQAIPGTGLGLAISQAIAHAHDTTITVQSSIARGTTFELRLATAGKA